MDRLITSVELCVECDQNLEHCHGTALIGIDDSHHCSDDPDCRVPVALHVFIAVEEN